MEGQRPDGARVNGTRVAGQAPTALLVGPGWRGYGDRLLVCLLTLIDPHGYSWLLYRLTRCRTPWLKNTLIALATVFFRIDLDEAESALCDHYATFNDFFTRALRPGVRPIAADPLALVSPVDARVSAAGAIEGGTLLQVKGHRYSAAALLGDAGLAAAFADGQFATLYLSPRDYHRVHLPIAGRLTRMAHIPGALFSVSPSHQRAVPGLFARNERIVCLFATEIGPLAVCLVGAAGVGSMATVWAGEITPPYGRAGPTVTEYGATGPSFRKGEEIGRFQMGSTVVLLFPPGAVVLLPEVVPGEVVRLGVPLARIQR